MADSARFELTTSLPSEGKVYSVTVEGEAVGEAYEAAIREQLADQGVTQTHPEDLIVVHYIVEPKGKGVAA